MLSFGSGVALPALVTRRPVDAFGPGGPPVSRQARLPLKPTEVTNPTC